MSEVWKAISGYEGIYEVSNIGRVRSLDRINYSGVRQKGKIMKQSINSMGYWVVNLTKYGKQKVRTVHSLVAEAFIPKPDGLDCINHKDEEKLNNNVRNLEWCTQKYNCNYGTASDRRAKKLSIPIVGTVIATGEVEHYESIRGAARALNGQHANIWLVLKGKKERAYGRVWEYEKEGA